MSEVPNIPDYCRDYTIITILNWRQEGEWFKMRKSSRNIVPIKFVPQDPLRGPREETSHMFQYFIYHQGNCLTNKRYNSYNSNAQELE